MVIGCHLLRAFTYRFAHLASLGSAMTILVTGAAGFIGFSVANALMARGERVVGIDNLNDYYDPSLKLPR